MGLGVWLHLTDRHEHGHFHEPLSQDRRHLHDEQHRHAHYAPAPPGEPQRQPRLHPPLRHSHPRYHDLHHRHEP
jgi:hypothetical protein